MLASKKAITALCQNTDYKKTCEDSLEESGTKSSDPMELIKLIFQAATMFIEKAAKNSTTLHDMEKDPRGKKAFDTCQELAKGAVHDLQRSFAKFESFDISNLEEMLMDLKTWLSGAITQQETCLDSFEEIDEEFGRKMRDVLTTSMQMSSNALAMMEELSKFLDGIDIQNFKSRRLLALDGHAIMGHDDEVPNWLDRKLLAHKIKPHIVVAKDGSGKYKTINEAWKDIPKNSNKTFVIHIKKGVYKEKVKINGTYTNLMWVGDGPTKTRITGNLNFIDGTPTYHTATVAVQGDGFVAKDIGFENSAGPAKHQAVALRVSADKSVFYNCAMDGYQDTLYAHSYRQFYRNCNISGTIDFIFGDSAVVFQNCRFLVRKPMDNQQNIVTAQGRKDARQPTGIVIQNCTVTADQELLPVKHKFKTYLARPWKEYSRTIIMESFLDDVIQPEGYLPWNATFALNTLFYTEFNNRGPAAPKMNRVKWESIKELPSERIRRFTANPFLDGNKWVPPTRVPYAGGFIYPMPKEDTNVKFSPVTVEETKDVFLSPSNTKSTHHHNQHPSKSSVDSPATSPSPSMRSSILGLWADSNYGASPSPAPHSSIEVAPSRATSAPTPSPTYLHATSAHTPSPSYSRATSTPARSPSYSPATNSPVAPTHASLRMGGGVSINLPFVTLKMW